MRKLALSDEILLSIQQPARYIGGEVNMVVKDHSKVRTRFAFAFPDVYDIGMSHLGIQILYSMFNSREDVCCERVYSPWVDLDPIMREKKIPLFPLESQKPVKDFDFLGITLQYEMCYTNVLQILDLSQIPLHACGRCENDPIVIGGGPCAYNPEPLADFFDLFYIGEGETVYFDLIDRYQENKAAGGSRKDFLEMAAEIPGIYVPSFYDPEYNEDGTLKEVQVDGKKYKGKALYDILEHNVRRAFVSRDPKKREQGRNTLWYLWTAPNSPLYGRDKMTTFERYFLAEKETWTEVKNAYYRLIEKEETADRILQEFGLAGENVHIINGHVPVHQSAGESPVKCGGKVLIIDGGFCRAYHKETGIAGYTLIYNSYGLSLTAHEPFESTEKAIQEEKDIVSRQVAVRYNMKRQLVGDTDQGRQIRQRIRELKELIEAYRTAQLKELL